MKPRFLHLLPFVSMALAGCTLGPDFKLPSFGVGTSWKEADVDGGVRLPDNWWRLYQDGELNRLVDRALAANTDLAAARARVETSRALVGVDRARMFPTLDFNGSAGIQRNSADATNDNLPPGFSIDLENQRFRGTFDLSYDPDLWGRNKRLLEASLSESAASQAQLDSLRLGVAAEVCRQYFLLRGLDTQEEVLRDTIESRGNNYDIQKSKLDAGLIDGLSTSQAKTEVELARNDLAVVERQRGSAEHALAVLCGTTPSSFRVTQRSGDASVPKLRAGLPAEVLHRRPDVRAAEYQLRAANARIGVAEAAFYPNFALTASGGFESVEPKRFLEWENRVLSLGAGVAQPVFNAGSNRAQFDAAVSRRDEALANYRNSLLTALREVEDSLLDLKSLATSRSILENALASARDSRQLASERFDKGLSSYLEVIAADRAVLNVRLLLAQIDSQQRISFATLAKALGGGWSGK